jgi:hypothetical protein
MESNPKRMGRSDGPEYNSGEPIEMPLGACTPTPLQDIIARMVREAVEIQTGDDHESWDEANDFEMPTDEDQIDFSPYELTDMTEQEYEPPSDRQDSGQAESMAAPPADNPPTPEEIEQARAILARAPSDQAPKGRSPEDGQP